MTAGSTTKPAETPSAALGPEVVSGFITTADRTLHWTVSLHIDNGRIGGPDERVGPADGSADLTLFDQLGGFFVSTDIHDTNPDASRVIIDKTTRALGENPFRADGPPTAQDVADARLKLQLHNQERMPMSAELRDAMEPMFNDIADRERLGIVEDYLLAIAPKTDNPQVTDREIVRFALDVGKVRWSTEGRTYTATLDQLPPQEIELRRFWYVHRNCSISYHLSFSLIGYQRSPAFYFFVSMLQKLVAPKEFRLSPDSVTDGSKTPDIAPFQAMEVLSHRGSQDFWAFVRTLFNGDFARLCQNLLGPERDPRTKEKAISVTPWEALLPQEPYVEVPGLKMPHVRTMFYFADGVFRDLMLPRDDSGAPARRLEVLNEAYFDEDLQAQIEAMAARQSEDDNRDKVVRFDQQFWDWLARTHENAIDPSWRAPQTGNGEGSAAYRSLLNRMSEGGNSGGIALTYLFLSGFVQNIIDFPNQDASEILDSLDPIYPREGDNLDEHFFVRYANSRTLFNFVEKMRSLETGQDYIGTCPYAFLIHVLSLHNEFLMRDFERKAANVLNQVEHLANISDFTQAADKFYTFRRTIFAEYETHKYDNVFRYDTEKPIFDDLSRIRGIEQKYAYVSRLVASAENRTRDREERIRRDDDKRLNLIVAGVGIFSVMQVVFQMIDAGRNIASEATSNADRGGTAAGAAARNPLYDVLTETAITVSALAILIILVYALVTSKRVRSRLARMGGRSRR